MGIAASSLFASIYAAGCRQPHPNRAGSLDMMLFGRAPIMTIDSVRKMTSPTGWIRHRVTGTVGEAPTSRTFRLVQRLSHLWRSLGDSNPCFRRERTTTLSTGVPSYLANSLELHASCLKRFLLVSRCLRPCIGHLLDMETGWPGSSRTWRSKRGLRESV